MDAEKEQPDVVEIEHTIRAVRNAADYHPTGRHIVICLDGTGDMFDDDNSNIVHLVSCLKKSSPSQLTYYQPGIGTYDGGGLSGGFNSAFDAAVGSGLGVHIRDAYKFLMENYKQGDKICLFGFSRGSYTARCLAGFVHKMGILPAFNYSQVDFAYQIYKDNSEAGWKKSKEFKRTFSMDVSIHFIGVWDSVASVGFIRPRKLPLSSTPENKAAYFRHAVSIDERRAKFQSCRFKQKVNTSNGEDWKVAAELTPTESNFLSTRAETDVLEVFFAGCHCDVGGGAVKNEVRNRLANVPLRWMIRQCFECDTGIMFKTERLAEEGLDVHTLSPVYQNPDPALKMPSKEIIARYEAGTLPPPSRRSRLLHRDGLKQKLKMDLEKQTLENGWISERDEDWMDSKMPMNDELARSKSWWILEVIPIKLRFKKKDTDEWVKKVRLNMGRPRVIQEPSPNVHWTVLHKMQTTGYQPRIKMGDHSTWNIIH